MHEFQDGEALNVMEMLSCLFGFVLNLVWGKKSVAFFFLNKKLLLMSEKSKLDIAI